MIYGLSIEQLTQDICPNCSLEEQVSCFSWSDAKNRSAGFLKRFVLGGVGKTGEFYTSNCCDSKWLLCRDERMWLLFPSREKWLQQWESADQTIKPEFLPLLSKYGFVGDHYICHALLDSGLEVDAAIYLVDHPFDIFDEKNTFLMSQVVKVWESNRMVPKEIREVGFNAPEIRMGCYLPTVLESKSGQHIRIPAHSDFLTDTPNHRNFDWSIYKPTHLDQDTPGWGGPATRDPVYILARSGHSHFQRKQGRKTPRFSILNLINKMKARFWKT